MPLPVPYTVQRKPYQGTVEDVHGNVTDSWGTAVDLPVHGIAPGAMDEPGQGQRDVSMVEFSLLCPAGTVADERDRITLDGKDFDINGRPRDYTRGPWDNPVAGVVIELKRVEG